MFGTWNDLSPPAGSALPAAGGCTGRNNLRPWRGKRRKQIFQARSLQPSGRVIASGRTLLACLFMLAVWLDSSQPANAPAETYALLIIYAAWAAALTLLTWRDWWLDARLAAPAHVVDVAVFTAMLYSTEGYTSPYFTFFVFLLLSSAIRWGWQETAATAVAVIFSYFLISLLTAPAGEFDVERFVVRSGHLFILSAILIWFGSNQRSTWTESATEPGESTIGGEPLASALRAGMRSAAAREGAFLWSDAASAEATITKVGPHGVKRIRLPDRDAAVPLETATLFNTAKGRALSRGPGGRWQFRSCEDVIAAEVVQLAELRVGLAVPVGTDTGHGIAFLQGIRNLSTDHVDIGGRMAGEIVGHLQAAAVLAAAEESSIARARVSVARDLHDSVVQFLAGLGFRLEALTRSPADREELGASLGELKQLVLAEQGQLRAFIGALRSGGSVRAADLERDLAALCQRLGRQWNIICNACVEVDDASIPVRLQLDLQQLIRESVANAVRHGSAGRVGVDLRSEASHFCLTIEDDGGGFPAGTAAAPASLAGRVGELGGELTVQSSATRTCVFMRLPVADGQ